MWRKPRWWSTPALSFSSSSPSSKERWDQREQNRFFPINGSPEMTLYPRYIRSLDGLFSSATRIFGTKLKLCSYLWRHTRSTFVNIFTINTESGGWLKRINLAFDKKKRLQWWRRGFWRLATWLMSGIWAWNWVLLEFFVFLLDEFGEKDLYMRTEWDAQWRLPLDH